MTKNLPANPLAAVVARASQSLPARGDIAQQHERIRRGEAGGTLILADVSGSMADLVESGRRKIDVLQQALDAVKSETPSARIVAFATIAQACVGPLPAPEGGTALHRALQIASTLSPLRTVVICDGQPDDAPAALTAAKEVSGVIDTIYIGRDDNQKAKAFMSELARRFGGRDFAGDIILTPTFLQRTMIGLLTHG